MKAAIQHLLVGQDTQTFCTESIHIVDYTKSTLNLRELEAFPNKPTDIESFWLLNPAQISVDFAPFAANKLLDAEGNEIEHCECVLFPKEYDSEKSWLLFLEMKYKDATSKGSGYLRKASNQLFATLEYFRDKGFISNNKPVHLIISFPLRQKVPFESSLFSPSELQLFWRNQRAILRGVNKVLVLDNSRLKV